MPVDDGAAYLLNGDKAFISNSPIAGLLCVSATVDAPAGRQVQIFFVDTAAAGLTVESRQDFMGLCGHANATVRLRDVRVPRDMMLTTWPRRNGGCRTS